MSFFKKIKEKMTPPKANILLNLDKYSFVLGENIIGTLTIASQEEFDALEVRCEMQCVEEAKRRKRIYDPTLKREVDREVLESETLFSAKPTVSGPMKIAEGYTETFPFSVNIPAGGRLTYQSIDRKVTWSIKGVIAVEGRPDVTSRTTEIQVVQPSAAKVIIEKEVIRAPPIVREKEVAMIPCKYCRALMPQTATTCPNCGVRRTA